MKKHTLTFFYVFAFLISWSSWLVMGKFIEPDSEVSGLTLLFSSIGGLGPLLSLVLIEKITGEDSFVKKILSRITIKRSSIRWVLVAALAYPTITLISQVLSSSILPGSQVQLLKPEVEQLGFFLIPVMGIHFVASLLTSPLFEEPGWRGFALVRLQRRFGRLPASVIVGVLWWIWHQPMNIPFDIMPSTYTFLRMVTFSFFIDSLFNLSGKNLFIAMLAHQSYGTVFTFLNQGANNLAQLGLLLMVTAALRLRERVISMHALEQPSG